MISLSDEINEKIQLVSELIKRSHHVVVLTGAGISTPSGIPDFRSPGAGLWTHFQPMEVASLSAFRYNPDKFYQWLHPLASHLVSAEPNPAHIALAKLQRAGYISTIITQNIDGLHTRAGSTDVLEVHGSLNTLTCTRCFTQVAAESILAGYIDHCTTPHCLSCGGILKPDIILYEEQLPVKTWTKAEETSKNSDLMIVAGTSLEVMPSAKLPILALDHGASLVMVNNTDTFLDVRANYILRGDVAEIFPSLADKVLNG